MVTLLASLSVFGTVRAPGPTVVDPDDVGGEVLVGCEGSCKSAQAPRRVTVLLRTATGGQASRRPG